MPQTMSRDMGSDNRKYSYGLSVDTNQVDISSYREGCQVLVQNKLLLKI